MKPLHSFIIIIMLNISEAAAILYYKLHYNSNSAINLNFEHKGRTQDVEGSKARVGKGKVYSLERTLKRKTESPPRQINRLRDLTFQWPKRRANKSEMGCGKWVKWWPRTTGLLYVYHNNGSAWMYCQEGLLASRCRIKDIAREGP